MHCNLDPLIIDALNRLDSRKGQKVKESFIYSSKLTIISTKKIVQYVCHIHNSFLSEGTHIYIIATFLINLNCDLLITDIVYKNIPKSRLI